MLRKIMFWLLKRECKDRGLVFINIPEKMILDFEVESMQIEIVNTPYTQEDSPYKKSFFSKHDFEIKAKLNSLGINITRGNND